MTSRHAVGHQPHSHRHRSHGDGHKTSSINAVAPHNPPGSSDIPFTTDRKGDIQNLRYGSIDKYKVPKYRTVGYGRLVGLDRRFKILANSGHERHVDDESLDPSVKNREFPSLLRQRGANESAPVRREDVTELNAFSEQQDYVPIGRKRRRLSREGGMSPQNSANSRDNKEPANAYRSDLSSESDASSDADQVTHQPNEHDAFEAFKTDPINKKFIELRSQTDKDPQNVQAWLEFINHQESYFLLTSGRGKGSLDSSQNRAVTDMKVSLYERAINVVKDGGSKEKLILGYVQEGSKLWDTDKQLKEWTSILTRTKSINLWYEFLNFQQTNAMLFSYEKCLDTCLKVFTLATTLKAEEHDYYCCYTVLRLTHFMYEAGFTERSIAIWQALLEYNLLHPTNGSDTMPAFESFWESEHPRIGEKGAKGWRSGIEQEPPSYKDMPLAHLDPATLFRDWGKAEEHRSVKDALPARTLDDTIEDDPYRVILSSDLTDFLFKSVSEAGNNFLLQGFLQFCGLPATGGAAGRCRKWWTDPVIHDFNPKVVDGVLSDTSTLFASDDLLHDDWNASKSQKLGIFDFAVRALTLLAESPSSDDELGEYVIACQLRKDQKAARKIAKSLLKRRSNSMVLYNAFALVEARGGNVEMASNVWSTAITMTSSLGPTAQQQRIVLWHSWIWELVAKGSYIHALNLMTEAVPLQVITEQVFQQTVLAHEIPSAQQLRADAYYREQISDQLLQHRATLAEWTVLYSILQYLKTGHDFGAVVHVYQSTLALVNKQQNLHIVERLHQFRARHAHLHAVVSKSGYRPMQLVPLFKESMTMFPDNTMFSNLYGKYLRRAGAVDKIRSLSVEDSLTPKVASLLLKIRSEMSSPLYSGSTVHSVRRAFSNAVDTSSPIRCCIAVWLAWIEWELSLMTEQDTKSQKLVKEVYLSALRSCPWSKNLCLRGFVEDSLSRVLGDKQLKAIYRSMEERGLRIRHDMSDVLDDMSVR